jgi:hypothetical protein
VTNDLCSIQCDPVERLLSTILPGKYGIGKVVDVIPTELLSEEVLHPRGSCKLGKLSAVSEGIGKPECLVPDSKA